MTTFNGAVSRLKTEIRRRASRGATEISAVDVANVQRGALRGASRGAAVRRAFADLVDEGLLKTTNLVEYNSDTHHSVTVYRVL